MQPGGLVPRARGRIYVAFGEHPAAGGLYMFLESLWHFARPCGVSLALWVALWLIVAPWAPILTHMGYSWEAFGHFGQTLGLHFGTLGLHLRTPDPCWCLVGTFGCCPGPLEPLLWKMFKKVTQNRRQNTDKFNDILSFCGK